MLVCISSRHQLALIESDCVPVTLYEIQELWRSCGDSDHTSMPVAPDHTPTRPDWRRHTRERGLLILERPTQQPGPPAKLPKARSVENLVSAPLRAPFPGSADNSGEEVDYGDSDEHSPPSPARAGSISGPRPRLSSQAILEVLRVSSRRKSGVTPLRVSY